MIGNAEDIGNVPPASFTGIQFLEVNRTPACAGCAAKSTQREAELTVCRAVFRCQGWWGGERSACLAEIPLMEEGKPPRLKRHRGHFGPHGML